MSTASNFTTRGGKIAGLKSALLWVPTVALLLLRFPKDGYDFINIFVLRAMLRNKI